VQGYSVEEMLFHFRFYLPLDVLEIPILDYDVEGMGLRVDYEFSVVFLLQVQQIGQSDVRQDNAFFIIR
jgi:hypothetical protein